MSKLKIGHAYNASIKFELTQSDFLCLLVLPNLLLHYILQYGGGGSRETDRRKDLNSYSFDSHELKQKYLFFFAINYLFLILG